MKNMIAIVEPYVTFIQVMSEAMKLGLSCNVLGAGCQTSMLASYTSMHGNNVLAVSQGYSGRNFLGVEWVLPPGTFGVDGMIGMDTDSIKGYQKMTAEGFDICYSKPYCLSCNVSGEEKLKRAGPVCMNFPKWMRNIKGAFDPDIVSDPVLYTKPEAK